MNYAVCMQSPVGALLLTADGESLTGVYLDESSRPELDSTWIENERCAPLAAALRQFEEYFAGRRTEFDLPLAPRGTDFQRPGYGRHCAKWATAAASRASNGYWRTKGAIASARFAKLAPAQIIGNETVNTAPLPSSRFAAVAVPL
jgi:6-O-methylguanine DNA methyltransferase, ribonuclease-like domain